jgi:hypothetical protein
MRHTRAMRGCGCRGQATDFARRGAASWEVGPIVMRPAEGEEHDVRGVYREIVPDKRLVHLGLERLPRGTGTIPRLKRHDEYA